MQIHLDSIIFFLQKAGGVSTYYYEIAKRLYSKSSADTFIYGKTQTTFSLSKYGFKQPLNESNINKSLLRYLPFRRKIPSRSLFHSSYYRVCLQKNVQNITTVHDFTYEYFRSGIAKWVHYLQKSFAIHRSEGIICVSENTKKDLVKFFPNINKDKIKVIYNGVSQDFAKLDNSDSYLTGELSTLENKQYILYIGDRSPYKNFLQALEVLKSREHINLVVVGGGDFKERERRLMTEIQNKITHIQGVDTHALNIIYNNAYCLLYPSSYEGFGIPILEAMKAGCPVISTNVSSIPEVAGDAALLVDTIETKAFLEKLDQLEDENFRTNLIEKGFQQASKFSWDKCFEETYAFYEEVYKRKFG